MTTATVSPVPGPFTVRVPLAAAFEPRGAGTDDPAGTSPLLPAMARPSCEFEADDPAALISTCVLAAPPTPPGPVASPPTANDGTRGPVGKNRVPMLAPPAALLTATS